MTKTICIVGNSPNLEGKNLGSLIDKFENVCRLNDWVTKGYEDDVGTKITHWVTGCGRQIPRWSKKRDVSDKDVIVTLPLNILRGYTAKRRTPGAKRKMLRYWGYDPTDENPIWNDYRSEDFFDTMENVSILGLNDMRTINGMTVAYPSTGIAAIAYFAFVLKYKVYTVGFEFYQTSRTHYWGQATKVSRRHNFKKEAERYHTWAELGLITPLDSVDSFNFSKNFLLMGNGPSLRDVDFDLIKRNSSKMTVIGINRSYLTYPDHDQLYVQDVEPVVELFDKGYSDSDIAKMNIRTSKYFDQRIKVMSRRSSFSSLEIERLKKLRKNGTIKDAGPRAYKALEPGSVELAISTSIYESRAAGMDGVLRFYLVGMDMKHIPDDNHFYDAEVKKTCRWPNEGSMPRQIGRSLNTWKIRAKQKHFDKKNVEIIICDKNSALLKFYPKGDLSKILKSESRPIDSQAFPEDSPDRRVVYGETKRNRRRSQSYTVLVQNMRAAKRERKEKVQAEVHPLVQEIKE